MWKDTSDDVHFELDTYALLKASNVPAVPTAVGSGVLVGHGTWAQSFFDTAARPAPRVHCRLVLREVARPLEGYGDAQHLIRVLYHALQGESPISALAKSHVNCLSGHFVAWRKAEVLHGDISVNNIMIDAETNRGLLTDWDLCRFRTELCDRAAQPAGRLVCVGHIASPSVQD